ncbi:MAG: hypothetical protein K6C40_15145 [Thermoguttaceae bacterium]|nr:hypothetical protein [Thermoguttaceae bacterium]
MFKKFIQIIKKLVKPAAKDNSIETETEDASPKPTSKADLFKVNFLEFENEYEGIFSFFVPKSEETLLARYVGNEIQCKKGDTLIGSLTLFSEKLEKADFDDKVGIIQIYGSDTTEIVGILTAVNGNDCEILCKDIPVGAYFKNIKDFKVGDKVKAEGMLDFSLD